MDGFLSDWVPVVAIDQFPERKPIRVTVEGVDILLYLAGEQIFATGNRCTHQGAPLHRGRVSGSAGQPIVTCPLHGSMFFLADGKVMRGPATLPIPTYEARINDEMVEIRTSQVPA